MAAAVENGTVYLSIPNGFAALGSSDGSIKWKTSVSGFAYIVTLHNGVIYGATTETDTGPAGKNAIYALKGSDGSQLWRYDAPTLFSTPVVG